MADTDIKIKLTADPKPVRDAIKLIDEDLKELGGPVLTDDTTTSQTNPSGDKGGDAGQPSPTSNSDRVNQSRRDRTNTLILRELVALRRELQKTNQNHASPPTGTPPGPTPPPSPGTPPPSSGGNSGGTPPGGTGGDSNNSQNDNNRIVDAIGKLGAIWSTFKMMNQWTNTSQSRESLAYKTYGRLLTYDDYNVAGQEAVAAGKQFGYDYDVVMGSQTANMRYAGFANLEALKSDTQSTLSTAKAWNLDPTQMAMASGRMTGFGAFKLGEQQKFANILAESIVEHGMQGRADEELHTLQGIAETLASRNPTVTEDTLRSGWNIYSALATVNPNLRGERGGSITEKLINTASQGSRVLDLLNGAGTKYVTPEERQELYRKRESNPELYYKDAFDKLTQQFGDTITRDVLFGDILRNETGLSQLQIDEVLKALKAGDLVKLNEDTTAGENATNERIQKYGEAVISTLEQFDITLQDAKDSLGALINRLKEPFKGLFNDSSQGSQMVATVAATALPVIGGGFAFSKIKDIISGLGGAGGAGGAGGTGSGLAGVIANAGNIAKGAKIGGSVVAGGVAAYNTYTSLKHDDYRSATENVVGGIAGVGGAIKGATIGGNIGQVAGMLGGPAGVAIGRIVGTILGVIAGGVAGDKIGEFAGGGLYDLIAGEDKTTPVPRDEEVPETAEPKGTEETTPSSGEPSKRPRSHIEEELQQHQNVGPDSLYPPGARDFTPADQSRIIHQTGEEDTAVLGVSEVRESVSEEESVTRKQPSATWDVSEAIETRATHDAYNNLQQGNYRGASQDIGRGLVSSPIEPAGSALGASAGVVIGKTIGDKPEAITGAGLGIDEEPRIIRTQAAYDAYNNLQQGNYRDASKDAGRGLFASLMEHAGSAVGLSTGAAIGGVIGGAPGAIIGGGLGTLASYVGGRLLGTELGKGVGGSLYDRFFGSDEEQPSKEIPKEESVTEEQPTAVLGAAQIIRTQAAYDAYNNVQQDNYRDASKDAGSGLFASITEPTGATLGASVGMVLGGAIGGAPGAVIGGGLGTLAGAVGDYLLGDKLGEKAGNNFYDKFFGNEEELPKEETAMLGVSEVREPSPTEDISSTPVVRDTMVSAAGIPTYSSTSAETALAHNPALVDSRAGNFIPIRRDESDEDDNDNRGTVERQFRLMENDTRSTVDNTKALNDNTKALEKNNKGTLMERIKNMFSNITGKTGGTPTSSGAPVVTSKSPVIATSPSQAGGAITKISGGYFGEGGAGEGTTWKRQNDNVSFEGAQDGMLDAIDMLAKFYHEKTGNQLVVTAGTNGDHSSNGTPYGHDAGYKFDINDWGGGGEGALTGEGGTKGWFTDELIKYGRSLGLGMNWEGNHLDVSLVGDQWDGNGGNAGGFNPRKAAPSSPISSNSNQAKLVNTGNPLDDYATYMSDFGKERYGKDTPTAFWRTILRSEQGISNEKDTSYYNNPGGMDYAPYMSKEFGGSYRDIIDNGGVAHRIAAFDTVEHGLQAQVDYFLNKDTHDWAKQEIDLINQGKVEEAFRIHNEHYIANGRPLEEQGYWGAMREEFGRGNVRTGDDQRQPQFISPQSHAHGKDYVPYDNYPALLHKGERVLTRMEANELRDLPGMPIPLELQIDEDTDSISDRKFKRAAQEQYQYNTSHTFTSLPQLAIGGKVDDLGIHPGSSIPQFQSMMLPKWVEKLLQSVRKTRGLNNILRSILPTSNNKLLYHIGRTRRRDLLSDLRDKLFNKDGSINLDSGLWTSKGVPKEIQDATAVSNPVDKPVDQSIQSPPTTAPLSLNPPANYPGVPKEIGTSIVPKSEPDATEKKKTTPYQWIQRGAQYAREAIQIAGHMGIGGKHNKTLSKVDRFLGKIARGSSPSTMVQFPGQPFNKDGSINLDSGLWTSKGWPQVTKQSSKDTASPYLPKEVGTPDTEVPRPEVTSETVMKENPTQALTQVNPSAQVATTTPPIDTSSEGMTANSISIDLSVHVDGKIDGMTDANQGVIVTALATRFKQPDWLGLVSNGYMRRANR